MNSVFTLHEIAGRYSLTFYCGELPVDPAISATGHEPNGYFWEGVAQYLFEDADDLVFDSEGGMFCASGDRSTLDGLRMAMASYLTDAAAVTGLIERAEADGFEFDD